MIYNTLINLIKECIKELIINNIRQIYIIFDKYIYIYLCMYQASNYYNLKWKNH